MRTLPIILLITVVVIVVSVLSFPTNDNEFSRGRKFFDSLANTFFGSGFRIFYNMFNDCKTLDLFSCISKTANAFVDKAKQMDFLYFTRDVYLVRNDNRSSEVREEGRFFGYDEDDDDNEEHNNDVDENEMDVDNTSLVTYQPSGDEGGDLVIEQPDKNASFFDKLTGLFNTHSLEIGLSYLFPGLQLEISRSPGDKDGNVDFNLVLNEEPRYAKTPARVGGAGGGGGTGNSYCILKLRYYL